MKTKADAVYRTSDWPLAVALFASGFGLQSIEWMGSQRAVFAFSRNAATDSTVEDFWGDRLLMNPKLILMKAKELKSRLKSEQL